MPFVDCRHASIYFEVCGEGPPLVFAHGAGGNTLVWWQQVPYFARRCRILTFDHRGFGRSRCEAGYEQARHFAGDVAAVLDAADIEQAALVCQSMGGWTGLQFARVHPQRVRSLVLSGTPAGILTSGVLEALRTIATSAVQMEAPALWNHAHPALAADIFERDPARGFLYAQLAALNPAGSLARLALDEVMIDPTALREWSIPTLLVAGEHDRLFPPSALEEVAAVIPGARFEVIRRAGHSPYFEAPEEFNRLVDAFLSECGGLPPL
jgi:pimeloyl-ACP methyl ester carboxylesterase